MSKSIRFALLFVLGLLSCLTAQAQTDYYVTPSGAGAKTGADWANALAQTSLASTVNNTLAPGGTVYLGSGNYGDLRFTITSSGTSSARMAMVGVDTGGGMPSFKGVQTTRSYTTFTFDTGVSYWTLENIKIERRQWGVKSLGGNVGLIMDGMLIRDIRHDCYSFTDADNLLIQNCRAARYAEKGFEFLHSCDGVTLKNNVADCSDTGLVDDVPYRSTVSGPVGYDFHIKNNTNPPNTNILIEDCEALNNDEDTSDPDDFEQGDGFKMERENENITFRRCRAYRNQDAGYDLKGTNQELNDCYSGHSRYGFKLWYDGTLNNCVALGSSRQLVLATTATGYSYTANNCTFHNTTSTQFGAVMEAANTVYLNDCLFTNATNATNYRGNTGTWVLSNVSNHNWAANTSNPPLYNNPVSPWYGIGTNYDNNTYGTTRGYNSTAISVGGTISVNLGDVANSLAATDEVGAIPSQNWTNSTANNQTFNNLVDHDGNATTADISFANSTYSYTNNTGILAAPMDDDAKMMRNQRGPSSASTMAAVVTQVPYATYDVYVYWGGRTPQESVPATMTVEFQQLSGGTYTTTQTKYIKDTDRLWDGTYDESTATVAGNAVDGQEYVVFRNVTTPEFRIRSTTGVRTGICGLQIVEQ